MERKTVEGIVSAAIQHAKDYPIIFLPGAPLKEFGLDSFDQLEIILEIEEKLNVNIIDTINLDDLTFAGLIDYVTELTEKEK